MNEYRKPYLILFDAVAKAIEKLRDKGDEETMWLLALAQQQAEMEFIKFGEKEEN